MSVILARTVSMENAPPPKGATTMSQSNDLSRTYRPELAGASPEGDSSPAGTSAGDTSALGGSDSSAFGSSAGEMFEPSASEEALADIAQQKYDRFLSRYRPAEEFLLGKINKNYSGFAIGQSSAEAAQTVAAQRPDQIAANRGAAYGGFRELAQGQAAGMAAGAQAANIGEEQRVKGANLDILGMANQLEARNMSSLASVAGTASGAANALAQNAGQIALARASGDLDTQLGMYDIEQRVATSRDINRGNRYGGYVNFLGDVGAYYAANKKEGEGEGEGGIFG